MVSPTADTSLMMRLAISYPGAALPPITTTRGTTCRPKQKPVTVLLPAVQDMCHA